jgi:hypothetical protein
MRLCVVNKVVQKCESIYPPPSLKTIVDPLHATFTPPSGKIGSVFCVCGFEIYRFADRFESFCASCGSGVLGRSSITIIKNFKSWKKNRNVRAVGTVRLSKIVDPPYTVRRLLIAVGRLVLLVNLVIEL